MTDPNRLQAFLERHEGVPVTWGKDDCSAVFAPWLAENGVLVKLPVYSSKEEAHALIRKNGGLVATWDLVLYGTLPERFGMPQLGDIAVIDTRLLGEVGVICAAGGICAWRKETGGFFWLTPRSYKKVWAVSR
ncbi:MAG TPA: hypothetical protein VFT89_07310 [Rhizobiaceae bacterium]|nr:hypothetical protein [Rhizobiaceae bacterium]